jgi:hypothetical protein
MRHVRLSVLLLSLVCGVLLPGAACDSSAPTAPTPPPPPATYGVTGVVSETVDGISRPLADTSLWLTIWETEGLPAGLTLRGSGLDLITDSKGRYTARVPKSRVFVTVHGFKRQPCIASGSVNKDTTIDVQVFPQGRSIPMPPSSLGPIITGFVYETTAAGRKPLRGAEAWLDISQDGYVANTETDETGHFFLCRVDTRVRMDVFMTGYEPYQYGELVSGTGDRYLQFEFTRDVHPPLAPHARRR